MSESVNLYVFSNQGTGEVDAIYSPDGAFKDMPAYGFDDMEFLRRPYLMIPRLSQYSKWFIQSNKETNIWLSEQDPVVRLIMKLTSSLVIGDGMKSKIFQDLTLTTEDKDLTDIIREWVRCPVGSSPDNRGKTMSSWVIPMIFNDNITCGASAWYKRIGVNGFARPEEVGKLAIKWLDPRSYVKVFSEFHGYAKLIQFRRVQYDSPKNLKEFDKWMPAIRSLYKSLSSTGPVIDLPPIDIKSEDYYWFNLFIKPPIETILQTIVSKIVLRFLEDRFIEKATYPFFVVKVPRHAVRDSNQENFQKKLNHISKIIAQYRSGDCIAIEGVEYDFKNGEAIKISEGWEIEVIDIQKASIDFSNTFRHLNSEIAYGLLSSISVVSPMSVEGGRTTSGVGNSIGANINQIVRQLRLTLADEFRYIFRDVIKLKTGKKVDLRLIDISFSKIREEDAAQFLNQIISTHGAGMLLTNEGRLLLDRIGMDLPPLPFEMTPEGQTALQIDELLNTEEPPVPQSFLQITASTKVTEMEQVRDQVEKSKQMKEEKVKAEKEKLKGKTE